jgi:hypothetical protein
VRKETKNASNPKSAEPPYSPSVQGKPSLGVQIVRFCAV